MIGYLLAVLIGLSLGLMGGGGSILTVPILVYALKMDPKLSIALSLAIVSLTSLIGAFRHYKNQNIDFKIAAIFAPVAMAGTFIGAKLSQFLTGEVQLVLFSIIMLLASFFMFKSKNETMSSHQEQKSNASYYLIAIQAVIVGIVTGLVGVGGGFLIVPALVLLAKIDMKKAIGTSLLIISLNSLSGFVGYLGMFEIPWSFLFKFSLFSIGGILIGSHFVKYVSQQKLKKGFAIFLIFMGVYILIKNWNVFNA